MQASIDIEIRTPEKPVFQAEIKAERSLSKTKSGIPSH